MKARFAGIISALLMLPTLSGSVMAQVKPGQDVRPPIIDKTAGLILSVGDVIQIYVPNHGDVNATLNIPTNGRIVLQEVGEFQAAGVTAKELEARITAALDKLYNNVSVIVSVREVHSRQTKILGAVRAAGPVDMGVNQWRLLDLIANAGGLTPRLGFITANPTEYDGRLVRNDRPSPLDISRAFEKPDDPANIVIQPGDLIIVDLKDLVRKQVHVLGQVPKPGGYELFGNTNILNVFDQSGQPLPSAALSRAYVLRTNAQGGTSQIALDLRPLIEGRADETATKFQFQPNDILFIPEVVNSSYMVWGQVGRSGQYIIPEKGNVTLLDAINSSGAIQSSDLKKVQVVRTVNGKQTTIPVDVKTMVDKGDRSKNIVLQPNDVVFVPPIHHVKKLGIQDIFTPLTYLSFLGFRFFGR